MAGDFLLETGTGIAGANAYVSVDYCDSRFLVRGQDSLDLALNSGNNKLKGHFWVGELWQKQAAIIRATDYIDAVFGLKFKGSMVDINQSVCFPRDVFLGIPLNLKKATAEYAIRALSYRILIPDSPNKDSSENTTETVIKAGDIIKTVNKIGPLSEEIQYSGHSPATMQTKTVIDHIVDNISPYPLADLLIQPLLNPENRHESVIHTTKPEVKPGTIGFLIRN